MRRFWLVAITVGPVVFLLAALLKPADPRLYEGSTDRPLGYVLEWFRLKSPPCEAEVEGLRYYFDDAWMDTMYLRFEAPERCVREFLVQFGRSGEGFDWERKRREPLTGSSWWKAREFGWLADPAKEYVLAGGDTSRRTHFEVALDPGGPRVLVYLHGYRA
ncbi:hypothetical protein [Streptoalloteichus hindustanus]|uniref:hypothetical protein n=1 Tax=Streptoalloteichus hindustanus TaxID=2017 RepID=UPI000935BC81|nr:hypothetical protein [Streptoalloteichus hindustanus]